MSNFGRNLPLERNCTNQIFIKFKRMIIVIIFSISIKIMKIDLGFFLEEMSLKLFYGSQIDINLR